MALSRKKTEKEIGMANGGFVPDFGDIPVIGSSFDVGPSGSTTFKTGGQIPEPPINPALTAQIAAAQAVPRGTTPPMAQVDAPMPQMRPSGPMPTMMDVLRQAQQAGNQMYGNYTPEKRNELYAMLLSKRGGMGNSMGTGLAIAGDAISRGYGRVNTDFLDKTLQGQDQATKDGLGAFDEAQKQTLQATSAGMSLQGMDPNSAASKIAKEAYAPLLMKLGYTPDAIERMSGANVEAVAKVASEYGGKEMENLFRQASLIVQQQQAAAEAQRKKDSDKTDALKALSSHPVASLLPTATNRALKEKAGLGGESSDDVGPYGAEVTRGGRAYIWSPVTKKYHPKP